MRVLAALVLVMLALAGCPYPEPKDRCEGPCAVYAVHPPIAHPGDLVALEGTFDEDSVVTFPGSTTALEPTESGAHRLTVTVPADATAGGLVVTASTTYTEPIGFRATTFQLELGAFRDHYEQTDIGRFLGGSPIFARVGGAVASVGVHVFLIGGASASGVPLGSIDSMVANADGTVTEPATPNTTLVTPRTQNAAIAIGPYVYAIGGLTTAGPTATVEGATYDLGSTTLGPFGDLPDVRLRVPRAGLSVVVVGNYLYAIGGTNENGDVAEIERAPISEAGLLGAFETVPNAHLAVARSRQTVAVDRGRLYVIGGYSASRAAPVAETERFDLLSDGAISETSTSIGNLKTARSSHTSIILGDTLYAIGGTDAQGALASVERARLTGAVAWEPMPTALRHARTGGVLATVGNHVYLFGGRDGAGALSTFERASIIGHATTDVSQLVDVDDFTPTETSLGIARAYPTTLVLGTTLYVIGGSDSVGPKASIEKATIASDGTLLPFADAGIKLAIGRMAPAAFIYDNFVYIVGGRAAGDYTFVGDFERAAIRPDGTLGPFTHAAGFSLPGGEGYNQAVVLDRTLYVLGGMRQGATTAEHTQIANTFYWPLTTTAPPYAAGPSLTTERAGFRTIVMSSRVYALAGFSNTTYPDSDVATFDATGTLGTWMPEPTNTPAPREGGTLAVLGDTVLAIGGTTGPAAPTQHAQISPDETFGPFATASTGSMPGAARFGHALVVLGNHVFAIGGLDVSNNLPVATVQQSTIR